MNVEQGKKKKKYNINDFADPNKGKVNLCSFPNTYCVCDKKQLLEHIKCKKCGQNEHKCLQAGRRGDQCLKCVARNLDPMYTVKKPLFETCFKTLNVFEYQNQLEMTFDLDHDDASSPIQIRGLYPRNKALNWPMQGSFYINGESIPFQQLKPLLVNTNRKSRREDYIIVPKEKVLIGKNSIAFKIPRLTKNFQNFYKVQIEGVYFIGVYSIYKLSKENLIKKVIRDNKMEKQDSIKFLNSFSTSDFQVQKQKISLMCPYTKQKIRIPVRGRNCEHFSCLCLETLIVHQESLRTWICPICDKDRINEPVIDMWIYQLLMQDNKCSEVILSIDGAHQWVRRTEEVNELSDDSEQAKMVFVVPSKKPNPSLKRQNPIALPIQLVKKPMTTNHIQQIVLVDDDDQIPLPKKSEKPQKQNISRPSFKKTEADKKKQAQVMQQLLLNKQTKSNQHSNISNQHSLYRAPDKDFLLKLLDIDGQNKRNSSKKRSQQVISKPKETKSNQKLSIQQPADIQAIIVNAINKQFKNMSIYEFQRHYVKTEQKQKIPEGVRKLFKEIL